MVAENLKQIQLQIGNKEANIDGASFKNDVAPEIINNVTVVPLRYIAENLEANVLWIPDSKEIQIVR